MRAREADALGEQVAAQVVVGQVEVAYGLLAPVLAERTRFTLLDRIGRAVGAGPLEAVSRFLERVAVDRTEGGWVIIGSALGVQRKRDLAGAFDRCRAYIAAGDVWYIPDILGERVPGPALVDTFQPALDLLAPWREDPDRWVRRAVGVSVHFWAKRSRGAPELADQAAALLAFLEPMFEERDIDAVKGVGWGLKTLGRHYAHLVAEWLPRQTGRPHRALIVSKALTYLSDEQRARVADKNG